MSEHTPQHPDREPVQPVDPDPSGVDPTSIDVVAGDPPVPITVWRTARTADDAGRTIGTRLAYRLVSAYSRPGEAVIDLTDGHALAGACAAGGRRHHPGWFTDASSLIIGPATPPAEPAEPDAGGRSDDGDVPDVGAWFGDDLTDPDLPPATDPADDVRGAACLVVACWPLHADDVENRTRLACLLTTCARLLRPGGHLVLVVAAPTDTAAAPEDFSPLAQAAATVGLGYLQHIVAVTANTDSDAFVYHVTDEELLALAHEAAGRRWPPAHLRVHADLLVFSQPAPPSARGQRRDGGARRG